ncbi:MAG: peptide-methionine (S)-S-oxide reductase MsrA [Solobacterium sp.]|nr:peptide-methionine (S)-S-oxide reductase MsrA [Solobacterium sp.]
MLEEKIRSDRMTLRRLRIEDAEAFSAVFGKGIGKEKAEEYLSVSMEREGVIMVIDTGMIIGFIEVFHIEAHSAEIGYRIMPEYRNQKYAKDAVFLLTKYLHEHEHIRKITAKTRTDNEWSVRVLEHNGYERIREENGLRYYAHYLKETKEMETHAGSEKEIILAGGCFWGLERAFRLLDGVKHTSTGYANGNTEAPVYEEVCRNETGYKEAVRILYDPDTLSLDTILEAFFLCIDPTVKNRQGNDIGTQYQTGVYYTDESDREKLKAIFAAEKKKYENFYTELEPLKNFWTAEEYHQNYLEKHPDGYCHIAFEEMEKIRALNRRKL